MKTFLPDTQCGRLAVGLLIAAVGVVGGNVAAVGLSANKAAGAKFHISIQHARDAARIRR
jgi:hypothetical protein